MALTVIIPARTLTAGTLAIGPVTVPAGLSRLAVDVEAGGMVAGQTLDASIELSKDAGATWEVIAAAFGFAGPYVENGVTQTHLRLAPNLGTIGTVRQVAANGWRIRASITLNTGTLITAGGSLVAT